MRQNIVKKNNAIIVAVIVSIKIEATMAVFL